MKQRTHNGFFFLPSSASSSTVTIIILMLALLRTSFSSALSYTAASSSASSTAAAAAAASSAAAGDLLSKQRLGAGGGPTMKQQQYQPQTQTLIRLRLATRTDVPAIQRCNLACLPENYNSQFYCSHLRQWPEFALVAEAIETTMPVPLADGDGGRDNTESMFYAGGGTLDGRQQQQQQMFRPRGGLEGFPPAADYRNSRNSFRSNHNMRGGYVAGGGGEPKIVAYVLGKVERRPVIDYEYPIEVRQDYYGGGRRRHTGHIETLGHVTSLAVLSEYRRLGLGRALMEQLQCHMQYYGGGHPGGADGHVTSCGLHVRVSNQAAYRLYQNDGYEIESVLPHYYQDGEEAYYMRKMLPPRSHRQTYTAFDNPLFGNKKVWKHGPEHMRLPRIHCAIVEEQEDHLDQQQIATESSSLGSSNSNNNEEWLTGSI